MHRMKKTALKQKRRIATRDWKVNENIVNTVDFYFCLKHEKRISIVFSSIKTLSVSTFSVVGVAFDSNAIL